ncbi:MAG: RecB family exonuclease [Aeromicrobium sp.]
MRQKHPDLAELFTSEQADEEAAWLGSDVDLFDSYVALEDPLWVEPDARELRLELTLASGLTLGGVVDRLDIAPDGRIRVFDDKTGRAPHPHFEARALFQLRFHALVIWRTRGVVPALLQLLYFADRTVLEYAPTEHKLLSAERRIAALWEAIAASLEHRDFQPRRSAMCQWCSHGDICREWRGTPPPMPAVTLVAADAELPDGRDERPVRTCGSAG